jgi:CRP/FNR family transcriptional regulator, cyclic AMP receptor protein
MNNLKNIKLVMPGNYTSTALYLMDIESDIHPVETMHFKAGATLFSPDIPNRSRIYIVKKGRIDLFRLTRTGKRLVLYNRLPGSFLGIRNVFCHLGEKNFAVAVEDSICSVITKDQLLELSKIRPTLMINILDAVLSSNYLLEDRFIYVAYDTVIERLSYFLINNVDAYNDLIGVTHEEIANNIGTARQTVTTILNMMKQKNLITIKSRWIHINDVDKVQKILDYSDV